MSASPCAALGVSGAERRLEGIVVAHAATSGGMLIDFGGLLAEKVIDEGGKLHFFASTLPIFSRPPSRAQYEAFGATFHGLELPRKPAPWRDLVALVAMALRLRRLKVQILHTRSATMGALGAIAGRLAGVPVIIHHQDDLFSRDGGLAPAMRWLIARLERALSMVRDRSMFVSATVLDEARRIGFDASQCLLVGNDLSPVLKMAATAGGDCADRTRHPLLAELGIPEGALVVGSIGRLAYLKGFDTLVLSARQICAEFPGCYFLVRGDGPLREQLKRMIAELGLSSRVFLCHRVVPTEELGRLYRSFDLFMLPTRREGFGMVFAEAMAFGVPVVGPHMAPVSEVVGPGCGILAEPENVEQYCGALRTLLSDAMVRQTMARKAREYALKTWCGETAADRIIQVYCDLLRSKGIAAGAAA
jgi:glycosyltransferase involved in cell wall biosynthesis